MQKRPPKAFASGGRVVKRVELAAVIYGTAIRCPALREQRWLRWRVSNLRGRASGLGLYLSSTTVRTKADWMWT